jgi:hypothetical protein
MRPTNREEQLSLKIDKVAPPQNTKTTVDEAWRLGDISLLSHKPLKLVRDTMEKLPETSG